jgi:hypothetical protein
MIAITYDALRPGDRGSEKLNDRSSRPPYNEISASPKYENRLVKGKFNDFCDGRIVGPTLAHSMHQERTIGVGWSKFAIGDAMGVYED